MHFGCVKRDVALEGNELVDRLAIEAAVEDGPADRRTGGPTDGQRDERKDGRKDGRADRRKGGRAEGRTGR